MKLDLARLFLNPDYYLLQFSGNHAQFVRMTRETYHRSIFTDQSRIVAAESSIFQLEIPHLLNIYQKQQLKHPPIRFIFHIAHCGSTLLSRALDLRDKNLVCREPYALRQLAVDYTRMAMPPSLNSLWGNGLRLTNGMLGRTYEQAKPCIVKANVPVNFVLEELMDLNPESPTILLYSDLQNFLIAALKSEDRRRWAVGVLKEVAGAVSRIDSLSSIPLDQLTPARAASCLWLAQMFKFEEELERRANIRSLNCETLFDKPFESLKSAFNFFTMKVSDQEVQEIVSGNLFSSHAKNPQQKYTSKQRKNDQVKLSQQLTREISEGFGFVEDILGNSNVLGSLSKPLVALDG